MKLISTKIATQLEKLVQKSKSSFGNYALLASSSFGGNESDARAVRPVVTGDANPFGTITKPPGVENFGGAGEIGILVFLSNLLQLGTVIAGLWVLLNFILAGFEYISSQGDSGAHAKVREKITNSVIGLIIIAVAYTLVAVIGLILFGSASYFLNPTLVTPGNN